MVVDVVVVVVVDVVVVVVVVVIVRFLCNLHFFSSSQCFRNLTKD